MTTDPAVRWDEDGRPHWVHECLGQVVETQLPLTPAHWQRTEGDSLDPSINCRVCDTHGWWSNGQWFWSGIPRPTAKPSV